MVSKFWDKLAEGVAQKWSAQKLGPALAFWGVGVLAWVSQHGWEPFKEGIDALNNTPLTIALATGALMVLAASSVVVEWLQFPVIQLAEGYWPGPFRRLRFSLARNLKQNLENKQERWEELETLTKKEPTSREEQNKYAKLCDEFARLEEELSRYPVKWDSTRLMPTSLGNLLSSAEEYPDIRYGLSISVCWPRLWLLLPQETQESLSEAREGLNAAARLLIWGLLFFLWAVWAWWAAVTGAIVAVVAYLRMLSTAGAYADLLRSAFDLYRFSLYESLRFPLPDHTSTEENHGKHLSEYLKRGICVEDIRFIHPS